ncbi:Uracil-DNA glycosylase superfamily protein [Thermococcus sp. 4557]|uniref:uracil-DNA glycosylase family protein n=1 Tax=Thermococcus sp. (strain CGMCC 1.5172 / 4557) TaxID=1042877 RepID=UPI000219EBC0|nr:uracil-DNA glycosylase family protein [Thermococcus sp. 4557]AEK72208.1 Uracil-DNA glycosylase superfamily protein [Thermococcus sp. 4557]
MLLRLENLKRVGELYINPTNLKVAPLALRDWRDFLSLDERTYGVYARTIYNPQERFLVVNSDDMGPLMRLEALYWEFLMEAEYFCGTENLDYQLRIGEFDGLPFANGWVGSGVVLVGEAPGRRGCGKTGICFYRDASGMLLRKTLFSLGINPDFLYITNVLKCNPPQNRLRGVPEGAYELLAMEIEAIKPGAIFAIGRTAEKTLKELGFEVEYLKHPAWYVRRGLREPSEEILAEYAKIREAMGEWRS